MTALGAHMRALNGAVMFGCPACGVAHFVNIDPTAPGPCWAVSWDDDKPTMDRPAMFLQAFGWKCHVRISAGRITFIEPTTHRLAGLTVDMPYFN